MSSGHRDAAQKALNSRDFAAANVHALLYLADEQRLANLIAACRTGALSAPERRSAEERIGEQLKTAWELL